jgi:hypothetical protein
MFPNLSNLSDDTDVGKRRRSFDGLNLPRTTNDGSPVVLYNPNAFFASGWGIDAIRGLFDVVIEADGFPRGVPNDDRIKELLYNHIVALDNDEQAARSERLKPSKSLSNNPSESAKILAPAVTHMLKYYLAMKSEREVTDWNTLQPFEKDREKDNFWPLRDKQLLVQLEKGTAMQAFYGRDVPKPTQPYFLPLSVSAPPRQGKSAIALLLCGIAKKIGFTVLFSVAPNKLTVLNEMVEKVEDVLGWPSRMWGIGNLGDGQLPVADKADEYDLLFYSSDVLEDCARATKAVSRLAEMKKPCFHIHDEGQTIAKIEKKLLREGVTQAIIDATVLAEVRKNYPNSRGLLCNVTATMLPTYVENMWGESSVLETQDEDDLIWSTCLLPAPIESLRPAGFQVTPGTSGYFGVDRLEKVGTLPVGMLHCRDRPTGVTLDRENPHRKKIVDHFVEFLNAPPIKADGDANHEAMRTYMFNLTREQTGGRGGAVDWINDVFLDAAILQGKSIAFVIFASTIKKKDVSAQLGLPADAEHVAGAGRGTDASFRNSHAVKLLMYDADAQTQPDVFSAESCKDAIAIATRFGIDKIAIAGYGMLEAAVTVQTDTMLTDGRKRTFAIGYVCTAHSENAPLDELFQMVGRSFADFRQSSFDYRIRMLCPPETLEHLKDIAEVEKRLAMAYDDVDLANARNMEMRKHVPPPAQLTIPNLTSVFAWGSSIWGSSILSMFKAPEGLEAPQLRKPSASGPAAFAAVPAYDPNKQFPIPPVGSFTAPPIVDSLEDLRAMPLRNRLALVATRLANENTYDAIQRIRLGKRRVRLSAIIPRRIRRTRVLSDDEREELVMALLQAVQKAKMTAPNYDNMETIVNHTIFRWEHMPMSDSTLELDIFRNDCALPIANDGMRPKNRVQQYANQLTDTMKKVQDALGIDDLYSASASDF